MFSAHFSLFILFVLIKMSLECQLPDGTKGKCMEKKTCPTSTTKCANGNRLCCPMFQRIVTPNVPSSNPVVPSLNPVVPTPSPVLPSPSPVLPSPSPAVPSYPPVTESTAISTWVPPVINNPTRITSYLAQNKCQEYMRNIKKRATITTYVFGGTESLSREYPHMAALGYGLPTRVDWLCGGSLISEFYVVTAAHCLVMSALGDLIRVRLGDLNLLSNTDDARPSDYGVAQKIIHPGYQLPTQYNDIGLIRLDRQVEFNEYVRPICLQTSYLLPNYNFTATGWGRTELAGKPSDVLMKVNLDYFPFGACQQNYAMLSPEALPYGILDMTQLCAGSYTDNRDTCQGDSGGPLQIKSDFYYLAGITSFGKVCGIANSPAVYTRVSFFVPWIEQTVWQQ